MSSIGTGYDLAASTFSPDGRIFQVEYAQKAVDNSGTVVALRGSDGVVLCAEKLIANNLVTPESNPRILQVAPGIGLAVAGMYPDGKHLARYAQDLALDYFDEHRAAMSLPFLMQPLSYYVHQYTLSILRPMAAAVFLAAWSKKDGAQLWMLDPSGQSYGYGGWALGKHRQAAKTEIEKLELGEKTVEELAKEAAAIIYKVRDETKDKNWKLELSWVSEATKGLHQIVPKEVLEGAETYAKQQLSEDDSDEEAMS